jgi:hypothetical protein
VNIKGQPTSFAVSSLSSASTAVSSRSIDRSCQRDYFRSRPCCTSHISEMAALAVGALAIAGVAAQPQGWQHQGGYSNPNATALEPDVNTATATGAVYSAQATAANYNGATTNVKGKAFDRFVTIWLENTDFSKAAEDPNLAWLATKGITLNNYFGVTHPSEPNYCASHGGDNFGMDNDNLNQGKLAFTSSIDIHLSNISAYTLKLLPISRP